MRQSGERGQRSQRSNQTQGCLVGRPVLALMQDLIAVTWDYATKYYFINLVLYKSTVGTNGVFRPLLVCSDLLFDNKVVYDHNLR